MSISRLALTWSAISPPPHCWNRLGGSLVCSAAVKRVRRSSFWSAVISIFTFGCAIWYSVATVCQKLFNGSLLPLCHQVRFTGLLERCQSLSITFSTVSYTHLTLPTIY